MRVMKVFILTALMSVVLLGNTDAQATLSRLLPESSTYEGTTFYSKESDFGFMRGRIDFAIYDREGTNEFEGVGFSAPGEGRYIYAYQIFNDYEGVSEAPLGMFSLFNGEGTALDVENIDSVSDDSGGVEPTDQAMQDSGSTAVWKFQDPNNGAALLEVGDHSWLLLLTSESGWVTGDYDIEPVASDDLVVPDESDPAVPEPATLVLLGAGSAFAILRRRQRS